MGWGLYSFRKKPLPFLVSIPCTVRGQGWCSEGGRTSLSIPCQCRVARVPLGTVSWDLLCAGPVPWAGHASPSSGAAPELLPAEIVVLGKEGAGQCHPRAVAL